MPYDYARLREITYLASSAAAIVTNGAGAKTYVKKIILHNTNTTTETVKIYTVPDSGGAVGTAGAGNIWFNQALSPNETVIIAIAGAGDPGILLTDTNDTIQAFSTTASKVTVQVYGGSE